MPTKGRDSGVDVVCQALCSYTQEHTIAIRMAAQQEAGDVLHGTPFFQSPFLPVSFILPHKQGCRFASQRRIILYFNGAGFSEM